MTKHDKTLLVQKKLTTKNTALAAGNEINRSNIFFAINVKMNKNTFCGTWYLSHCHISC